MIIWGFFSAIGWMGASWTVDKVFPDKPEKEKVMICKKQDSQDLICKEEKKETENTQSQIKNQLSK